MLWGLQNRRLIWQDFWADFIICSPWRSSLFIESELLWEWTDYSWAIVNIGSAIGESMIYWLVHLLNFPNHLTSAECFYLHSTRVLCRSPLAKFRSANELFLGVQLRYDQMNGIACECFPVPFSPPVLGFGKRSYKQPCPSPLHGRPI